MDPIANMLTQIKNAGRSGKKKAEVSYSKINLAILENLKNRGFISGLELNKSNDHKYPSKIVVSIKYKSTAEPLLDDIERVSRPGRRVYVGAKEIYHLSRGKAELIISTSKGMMTGRQAHKLGLGGEVICEVR